MIYKPEPVPAALVPRCFCVKKVQAASVYEDCLLPYYLGRLFTNSFRQLFCFLFFTSFLFKNDPYTQGFQTADTL